MKKTKSKILKIGLMFLVIQIITTILSDFVPLPATIEQYISILLPTLIVAFVAKVNIKERFKLNNFKLSSLGYIFLLFVLVMPVSTLISELTFLIFGENPMGIDAYVQSLDLNLLGLMLALAVSPSICEELMFRGLLIDRTAGVSIHKLALMSGVMFSLFHVGYDQLFYTLWMGIILGYVTIITNSIYPAVIIHFLNNGFAVGEMILYEKTGQTLTGFIDTSSIFGLVILCVISILSVIMVIKIIKRLSIIYNYDDAKRLESCSDDVEIYKQSNKFKVYWPQFIVILYVLLVNVIIFNS